MLRASNHVERRQKELRGSGSDQKAAKAPGEKNVLLTVFSKGLRLRAVMRSGHGQASHQRVFAIMPQGPASHPSWATPDLQSPIEACSGAGLTLSENERYATQFVFRGQASSSRFKNA